MLTTVDGHWKMLAVALLKAVWWDFYPTIRLYEGYLVYCVFVCFFVCFLHGYGFLSGGKSYGREILHACWPTIRTGLFPLGEDWFAGSHEGDGITSGMNIHSN